jgi:hypothetical protein
MVRLASGLPECRTGASAGPTGGNSLLTSVLAAIALAADPVTTSVVDQLVPSVAPSSEAFATGQNAQTVFQQTTLTKVGTIKSNNVSYELRFARR